MVPRAIAGLAFSHTTRRSCACRRMRLGTGSWQSLTGHAVADGEWIAAERFTASIERIARLVGDSQ